MFWHKAFLKIQTSVAFLNFLLSNMFRLAAISLGAGWQGTTLCLLFEFAESWGDMQEYEVIVDTMPVCWTVYRGQLFVFLC